jgi:hypothetical protein
MLSLKAKAAVVLVKQETDQVTGALCKQTCLFPCALSTVPAWMSADLYRYNQCLDGKM